MVTYYKIIYQDGDKELKMEVNPKELIPILLEIRKNFKVISMQDNEEKLYNISEILEKEKEQLRRELSNKSKEEIIYAMQKKINRFHKTRLNL